MRLISDFWVAAVLRDVRAQSGFAYLARQGAAAAGAIFIKVYRKTGGAELYGPAPQIFYDGGPHADERRFIAVLPYADEARLDEKLQRELDFDPDIWIVEIENFDRLKDRITIVDKEGSGQIC